MIYSPDDLEIYNENEGSYLVRLLKKKGNCDQNFLQQAHNKGKLTLEVLTKNMIKGDVPIENIL